MLKRILTSAILLAAFSSAAAASTVGSFSGGSFVQSGTITNSSGKILTGVTIDFGVDAGASGNGTAVWDARSPGGLPGNPAATFTNQIGATDVYFTASWLGLSVADGGTFSYSNMDYEGYNGGTSFNAGGFTLLDGTEKVLLAFADGSTGTGLFSAGSPSNVQFDIIGDEVSAVPLPASLPLVLVGFGALGLMSRRRGGAA